MADISPAVNKVWPGMDASNDSNRLSPSMNQDSHMADFLHTQAEYDDAIDLLGSPTIERPRQNATEINLRIPYQTVRFERPPTSGSEPGFVFAPAPTAQLNQSRNARTSQVSDSHKSGPWEKPRNNSNTGETDIPRREDREAPRPQSNEQSSRVAEPVQVIRSDPKSPKSSVEASNNKGQPSVKPLVVQTLPTPEVRPADPNGLGIRQTGSVLELSRSSPNHQEHKEMIDILPPFPRTVPSAAAILANHATTSNREPTALTTQNSTLHSPSCGSMSRPLSRGYIEYHPAVRQQRSKSPHQRGLPQSPDRVQKTKFRRKKPPSTIVNPETLKSATVESSPSQEDLLNILLFRSQQEKRARDAAKAAQQAKAAELEELQVRYARLNTLTQKLQNDERSRDALLEKYQKVVPGWKEKVKKLDGYLTGLTNDHHKLRDGAKEIQKQQDSLRADGLAIRASLGETQGLLEQRHSGSKGILDKAKREIEPLENAVRNQKAQLSEASELLDHERERNQRLEERLSEISNGQKRIMDLDLTHCQTVVDKLDELISYTQQPPSECQTNEKLQIKDMLDRCVSLLEEVGTLQTVKPSDLDNLKMSVKEDVASIIGVLEHSAQATNASQEIILDFKGGIQHQLAGLATNVMTREAYMEQLVNLREAKATIRERLHLTELAVTDARRNVVSLEERERIHIKENADVKAELTILRARPTETISTISRLQEIERLNTELHNEVTKAENHSIDLKVQLQCREEEASDLRRKIESIEAALTESQVYSTQLEEQRSVYENQAKTRSDDLRAELLKASKNEKTALTNEHLNTLHRLQRQTTTAQVNAKEMGEQLEKLKLERTNEDESLYRLRAQISDLESQVSAKEKLLFEAQLKVDHIAADEIPKNKRLCSLEKENVELVRQRVEVELSLSLRTIDLDAANEKNKSILTRINASLTSFNENSEQHKSIDAALEALFTILSPAKVNPHLMTSATQPQQANNSKPNSPTKLQAVTESPRPSTPDEVMLLGSQDGKPEQSVTSPLKPKRRANRHFTSNANIRSSQNHSSNMVIQESHVEETTVHRSVRKTTSSQGKTAARNTETPSQLKNHTSYVIPQFSQLHQSFGQSLDPESPLGDMIDFFPPTPIQSSSQLQSTLISKVPEASRGTSRVDTQSTNFGDELRSSRPGTQTETGVAQITESNTSRNRRTGKLTRRNLDGMGDVGNKSNGLSSDLSRSLVPKGILKDPKGTKRSHTTMDAESRRLSTKKRAPTRDIGPVIGDSQSPSARSRKSQRRLPDKYVRRFSGEE